MLLVERLSESRMRENFTYGCASRKRRIRSAGDKLAGARASRPVAWMAGRRKTNSLKPIDKGILGMSANNWAVARANAQVAPKVRSSGGRACNRRAKTARTAWDLAEAVPLRRGDSDGTVMRTRRTPGETLLVPPRNRRSKVGRITGNTGKPVEDEREAEGPVGARKRGNARGAKGLCCRAVPSSTREARAG